MTEFRKAIFFSIIISLVVGTLAGTTAGVVAINFVYGDLGGQLASMLPHVLRQNTEDRIQKTDTQGVRPPESEESSVIDIVEHVSPAVVSILVSKDVAIQNTRQLFPDDFFFGMPFKIEVPTQPQQPQTSTKRQIGGGTGFIITSDGMIATNKHVIIDDQAEFTVITSDNKRYTAKVLAKDPFVDFAVLKIDAKNLPIVKLGNSDNLRIGETVIAIGNALSEFSNTITKGVISGINRRVTAGGSGIGTEVIEEAIQTDAAINPGNSGGPLVNLKGEVVGINTAVSQAGQLIGFATPINSIKPAIESVKTLGRIVRPWVGVRYNIITPEFAKENKLPVEYGALLSRGDDQGELAVLPSSPADQAGLKENDIILEIDGVKITKEDSLARQVQKHKPGDAVNFKVLSQGKEKNIRVVLGEFK